jgi:hypothetical protein
MMNQESGGPESSPVTRSCWGGCHTRTRSNDSSLEVIDLTQKGIAPLGWSRLPNIVSGSTNLPKVRGRWPSGRRSLPKAR